MNTFVLSLLKVTCLFLWCCVFPSVPPPPAWLLLSCGSYLSASGCPKIPFMRFCFEISSPQYDYGFVPDRAQNAEILVYDLIPPRSVPLELQWRWPRVSSSVTQTWEQQTFASHVREKKKLFLSDNYPRKQEITKQSRHLVLHEPEHVWKVIYVTGVRETVSMSNSTC